MADVKWIKITTDVFDDEKILLVESMPEADAIIVIWFKLLCMAGKQNNSGVFLLNDKIAYTEEMLSTIFRRPLNTVRLALRTFEEYGMIELIDGVITIPNWEKHQNLDALEKKREADRERQKRKREEQKEAVTRLSRDASTDCRALDKNKIRSEIEKKNKEPQAAYFPENPKVEQAFEEYIKHRKAIKATMTDQAKTMATNKLKKLAFVNGRFDEDKAVQIINNSIMNGWKGLFELKDEKANTNHKPGFLDLQQSNTDEQLDELEELLLHEVNR